MKSMFYCVLISSFVALVNVNEALAQTTFGSLVDDIIDRDQLAMHPSAGIAYESLQISSYDPNPMGPLDVGAPASFANPDRNFFSGEEVVGSERHYTMLEDTGPGVITRWWMTSRSDLGEIKVFVDGNTTPVMSGLLKDLLGDHPQMGDQLSFKSRNETKSGQNFYAPIPYSESIKVVFSEPADAGTPLDGGVYYNIDYRKYNSTEAVQSYTAADPTTYSTQLQTTNNQLQTPSILGHVDNQHSQNTLLAAGQDVSYDLSGTGAIRRLEVKLFAGNRVAALKDTYVELIFDDQTTARVPVGQFFGNGDGEYGATYNTFEDLYRTVESDGTMTSRWVMPYAKNAQVRLVNEGTQYVNVALEVDSGDWAWNEGSMHFHANYIEENDIKTRAGNGTADFRYLTVRGQGAYAGDTLSMRNGSGSWWGEGDEKIYIDYIDSNGVGHNVQPNHYGTGTEDYYGYAYGHDDTFDSGFVSQPIGVGNNTTNGRTVNSRVRALDVIPFDESFKLDMEIWHWKETDVDYATTAYWYGRPGASAMQTAADLAIDYQASHDFNTGGIPDTAGDGEWIYMMSDNADPSAVSALTENLGYGEAGRLRNLGYGGGEHGYHNLPAISDKYLFFDAYKNGAIQGDPGYHELTMHPGGIVTSPSSVMYGTAELPYVVMRWIAGESSTGLANINGSVRNFVDNNDSVDFYIYVDGELQYSIIADGVILPESYFDFDVMLAEGSIVDFVLGNGLADNIFGDETFLRAIILVPEYQTTAIPGDANVDGKVDGSDVTILADNWQAGVSGGDSNVTWEMGDFNGDGKVDGSDVTILADNWQYGVTAANTAAVPEPPAIALFLSALLAAGFVSARKKYNALSRC